MMFYKYSTQGMQQLICGIRTVLYRHFRDRSKCNLQWKPSLLQLLFHGSPWYRYWKTTSSALPFWRGSTDSRLGTLCINSLCSTREKEFLHTAAFQTIPSETLLDNFCWENYIFFLALLFLLYIWVNEWIIWVWKWNISKRLKSLCCKMWQF